MEPHPDSEFPRHVRHVTDEVPSGAQSKRHTSYGRGIIEGRTGFLKDVRDLERVHDVEALPTNEGIP
jgi:hypothetical protein